MVETFRIAGLPTRVRACSASKVHRQLRRGVGGLLMRDNRPYDLKRRSDQDGSEAKQTKIVVLRTVALPVSPFVRTRYGMP